MDRMLGGLRSSALFPFYSALHKQLSQEGHSSGCRRAQTRGITASRIRLRTIARCSRAHDESVLAPRDCHGKPQLLVEASRKDSRKEHFPNPGIPAFRLTRTALTGDPAFVRRLRAFRCFSAVSISSAPPADAQPTKAFGSTFAARTRIKFLKENGESYLGQSVEVCGWVRTVRKQKTFSFVEISDGSSLAGLQVVAGAGTDGHLQVEEGKLTTGAAVIVRGKLALSPGGKQTVELKAEQLELVGSCDAESYPLQKKRHTLEFLRGIAHLRPRTNTIGAAMRIRNVLAYATHQFFQEAGFQYLHTPILSAADCEGAGELFQVTTLLRGLDEAALACKGAPEELDQLQKKVQEQGKLVTSLKDKAKTSSSVDSSEAQVKEAVESLLGMKSQLKEAETRQSAAAGLPKSPDGLTDYTKDFFEHEAFLSVSGQLNAEAYACALTDVYTFGPTFRAENSNTARHLAEFWMIEPEMAFTDLRRDVAAAEAYLKHCISRVIQSCSEDLNFLQKQYDATLLQRLQDIVDKPFVVISYTEAIERLQQAKADFEYPVDWGVDLQTEHERYLTEREFQGSPVFVTDYPKDIKAFYMRLNDDGKTVAAMDLLVPGIGELIGGSQREERLQVLETRMLECGLDKAAYWWYLDLRRYGSVPHAGFGLGFERLVQLATGLDNIRDVIPFPRFPGSCNF